MPKIIFLTPDGIRHEVVVENGYSVMEGAINANIEGIVAECGGACACATCHSYIDDAWMDKMPPMDDIYYEPSNRILTRASFAQIIIDADPR